MSKRSNELNRRIFFCDFSTFKYLVLYLFGNSYLSCCIINKQKTQSRKLKGKLTCKMSKLLRCGTLCCGSQLNCNELLSLSFSNRGRVLLCLPSDRKLLATETEGGVVLFFLLELDFCDDGLLTGDGPGELTGVRVRTTFGCMYNVLSIGAK